jgi:hypothetical protein
MALLLLEIPALRQRYGMFAVPFNGSPGNAVKPNPFQYPVTISMANPAVVTWTSHGLIAGDPVVFQSTGALPSPINGGRIYYVLSAGLTANRFQISSTIAGLPVDTSTSSQSGTQTILRPTVMISVANPAVVTWRSHGLSADDPVVFRTTGVLPSPINAGQIYYVLPAGLTANDFQISSTVGGPPVDTSASTQHSGTHTIPRNPLTGSGEIKSPLLWLAQRLAKNRERIGVHYSSDSNASRHLAAAVWRALLHDTSASGINCPTLRTVLAHAIAEWPTKWP